MQIYARAQNFPADLAAAQRLLETLNAQVREKAAEYNKAAESLRGMQLSPEFAELLARRERLERHIGELTQASLLAREMAAHEPKPPKRKLPELIQLPRKHKALLAAERAVEEAVEKVDAAHEAIRKFSNSDHSNTAKAAKQSVGLQAVHKVAVQEHLAASVKLAAERDAWHRQCDAALETAWREREATAHELLDKLEDLIWPLRNRTFFMMKRLRELRKVLK
jgi:hypothetical protein